MKMVPLLQKSSRREGHTLGVLHPRGYYWGKDNPVSPKAGNKTRHEELNRRHTKDDGPSYFGGPRCT